MGPRPRQVVPWSDRRPLVAPAADEIEDFLRVVIPRRDPRRLDLAHQDGPIATEQLLAAAKHVALAAFDVDLHEIDARQPASHRVVVEAAHRSPDGAHRFSGRRPEAVAAGLPAVDDVQIDFALDGASAIGSIVTLSM